MSDMNRSPYAPPESAAPEDTTPASKKALAEIARPVFLEWERLRLVYIAILGLVAITIVLVGQRDSIGLWRGTIPIRLVVTVIKGAVVANLLFFAGPICETYIRWLGYEKRWVRWTMFACGTLLSVALTAAVLSTQAMPN